MRINILQTLFLKRDDIPRSLLDEITNTLTIKNPKFQAARSVQIRVNLYAKRIFIESSYGQ